MRRSLLVTSFLCVLLIAAGCAQSTLPTVSVAVSPGGSPTPAPLTSAAPVASRSQAVPSAGASSTGGSPIGGSARPTRAGGSARPTRAACGDITDAWTFTKEQLDLLSVLTDDATWAAAHEPGSGLTLDPEALDRAIDTLATLPGQAETVQLMRSSVPLYRAAVKSSAPFTEASGVGPRLVELAHSADAIASVEIPNAIEVAGCARPS